MTLLSLKFSPSLITWFLNHVVNFNDLKELSIGNSQGITQLKNIILLFVFKVFFNESVSVDSLFGVIPKFELAILSIIESYVFFVFSYKLYSKDKSFESWYLSLIPISLEINSTKSIWEK